MSVQDTLPKEIVKKKGPFLIPIADPLADEKMTKKVLKLAKKASKRKQTKRGTKEVVKSIRKGLKGCVILHVLLGLQHQSIAVSPEGAAQVEADALLHSYVKSIRKHVNENGIWPTSALPCLHRL